YPVQGADPRHRREGPVPPVPHLGGTLRRARRVRGLSPQGATPGKGFRHSRRSPPRQAPGTGTRTVRRVSLHRPVLCRRPNEPRAVAESAEDFVFFTPEISATSATPR